MKAPNLSLYFICCFLLFSCGTTNSKKSGNSNRSENVANVKQGSPEKVNLDLGVGYLKRGRDGDLEIALEKFKKSLAYNPEYALAHSMIANVYDQKGLFNDAKKHYDLSIKYNNSNPDIVNNYANFLCQRGSYDSAINYYMKVAKNPQYSSPAYAYENAGICSYKSKNKTQAEDFFRKAVDINPKQSNSLFYLMTISIENKKHMKARAFLQRLEGLFNPSAELLLAGYNIEKALGNSDLAKNYLSTLKEKYPRSESLKRINEEK